MFATDNGSAAPTNKYSHDIMASAPIEVEDTSIEASSLAGSRAPASRASKLWEFFERDPPLNSGSKVTNVRAKCKCDNCPSDWFRVKGNSSLVDHLLKCRGLTTEQREKVHQIATDEKLSYAGKSDTIQPSDSKPLGSKRARGHVVLTKGRHAM